MVGSAAAWGLKVVPSPKAGRFLEEGDVVECGSIQLKVLHTPGHTPGGISLYAREAGAVFVGDTLFSGSIGRTDFPGGDYDTLISSIQNKLFTLPDDTQVHTGHMESTTIGKEKKFNPFCRLG
jgi:glyoxylase-like metal-dependent hydrolase (beta-lactamase superfamily II)